MAPRVFQRTGARTALAAALISRLPHSNRQTHNSHSKRRGTVKQTIRVNVNGTAYESEVEPRMLLVHYLRETLGLTGTHVGCDTTQCGACTVLLDDEAVKSCTMFAVQADMHNVTTVEGLAQNGELSAMQAAFTEQHGLQCGYCTPGMI